VPAETIQIKRNASFKKKKGFAMVGHARRDPAGGCRGRRRSLRAGVWDASSMQTTTFAARALS